MSEQAAEIGAVEDRVRSLLGNYATRAEWAPEPRPTWQDIVRDLQWVLGHERTYVAPESRSTSPTLDARGGFMGDQPHAEIGAPEVTFGVGDDWPTPHACRTTAAALDALSPARFGDILRAYADAEDARFDEYGPVKALRVTSSASTPAAERVRVDGRVPGTDGPLDRTARTRRADRSDS